MNIQMADIIIGMVIALIFPCDTRITRLLWCGFVIAMITWVSCYMD